MWSSSALGIPENTRNITICSLRFSTTIPSDFTNTHDSEFIFSHDPV